MSLRAIHGHSPLSHPIVVHSHPEDRSNSAQHCLPTVTGKRTLRRAEALHPWVLTLLSPGDLHGPTSSPAGDEHVDGRTDVSEVHPGSLGWLIYRGVVWLPMVPGWYIGSILPPPPWASSCHRLEGREADLWTGDWTMRRGEITHHGREAPTLRRRVNHHGREAHSLRRGLYQPWERGTLFAQRSLFSPQGERHPLCAEVSPKCAHKVYHTQGGMYVTHPGRHTHPGSYLHTYPGRLPTYIPREAIYTQGGIYTPREAIYPQGGIYTHPGRLYTPLRP